MAKYFHNGREESLTKAKEICLSGFWQQGYSDLEEFEAIWRMAHKESGEEQRDMLFEWSGYTLEMSV